MNAWWKTQVGDFFNSAHLQSAFAVFDDPAWRIGVAFEDGGMTYHLSGSWSTAAEAQEAIRQLVQGFDPASLD